MCLGDLISKLWKAWRFPPTDILVILTYTLAGMSNIWKSCLLIATYYPSLYLFILAFPSPIFTFETENSLPQY